MLIELLVRDTKLNQSKAKQIRHALPYHNHEHEHEYKYDETDISSREIFSLIYVTDNPTTNLLSILIP